MLTSLTFALAYAVIGPYVPDGVRRQTVNPFVDKAPTSTKKASDLVLSVEQILDDESAGEVNLRFFVANKGKELVKIDPRVFFPGLFLRPVFLDEGGKRVRYVGDDIDLFPPGASEPIPLKPGTFYGSDRLYKLRSTPKGLRVRMVIEYADYPPQKGIWQGWIRSELIPIRVRELPKGL